MDLKDLEALAIENQKQAEMEGSLHEKVIQVLGDQLLGCDIGEWGSCQYGTANDMYRALSLLEKERGRMGALKALGLELKGHLTVMPMVEVSKVFIEEEKEAWGTGDPEDEEMLENLPESFNSADEIFIYCRDQAWDLWSAAPAIGGTFYPELEIVGMEASPGVGPIFNVLAQNENYEVGFWCWWLESTGIVKDPDCYAGFDT